MTEKLLGALKLLLTNAKCSLMVPTNFAFGVAAVFITGYLQGGRTKSTLPYTHTHAHTHKRTHARMHAPRRCGDQSDSVQ